MYPSQLSPLSNTNSFLFCSILVFLNLWFDLETVRYLFCSYLCTNISFFSMNLTKPARAWVATFRSRFSVWNVLLATLMTKTVSYSLIQPTMVFAHCFWIISVVINSKKGVHHVSEYLFSLKVDIFFNKIPYLCIYVPATTYSNYPIFAVAFATSVQDWSYD